MQRKRIDREESLPTRLTLARLLLQGKPLREALQEAMPPGSRFANSRPRTSGKWVERGEWPPSPEELEGEGLPSDAGPKLAELLKPDELGIPTKTDQGELVGATKTNQKQPAPTNTDQNELRELLELKETLQELCRWWSEQQGEPMKTTTRPVFAFRDRGADGREKRRNTGIFCHEAILDRAGEKAKAEHMSLSQLVELLLWRWIGEPQDVVEGN
ncbi:MAG: hypothetical protein FJY85_03690 [Deltaproteobacteria bacterium]|nr:hypothetical protein [Deltaproteobacteria bacterium]